MDKNQICKRGVWDSSIPGISFDENGVSNYAIMFDNLVKTYPRGAEGEKIWMGIVDKIKRDGRSRKYDCVVGVSGGTDSCYLLHLAKNVYGLRPLAVNLDNGWNSDIAVNNIKKVTNSLNIDLETYVIDYQEVQAVLRAYMKASLPWIDGPTDLAINAVLYKIAHREGIKYILNGSDFRSEGKQPTEWTYTDARQLLSIIKNNEHKNLKSYPYTSLSKLLFYGFVMGIKVYRPLSYLKYQKKEAQKYLNENYKWQYYGGHHHENVFTKFAIAYWLPQKFGIDKRKITLSAQILSGEIEREYAIKQLNEPSCDPSEIERDKEYVIKKLDLSLSEFDEIFNLPNKDFKDYPSYMPMMIRFSKLARFLIKKTLPFIPFIYLEQEARQKTILK